MQRCVAGASDVPRVVPQATTFAKRRCQYSIERLCALQAYTKSKTMLHVLAVCVVTIVAPLLAILALDVVPLQRPEEGWDKNVAVWYRTFGGSFLTVNGVLIQMQAIAPAAQLTFWKCTCIGLFVGCGYTASTILLAKLWVFPIPFMTVVSMPAWLLFFLTGTMLTIGVDNLRQNAVLKSQVLLFARRLNLESNLLLLYPAYSVMFASLSGWTQIAFLFLLPAMKYIVKRIMKHTVADLEDLVPVVVITVDLFNALYQSKCMQSSTSLLATIGIIGIDVVQNFLSLSDLFGCMREVEELANGEHLANGAIAAALDIVSDLSAKEKAAVLKRTLQLLWRCELMLLVEYVEAAIPMLYAIYLVILHQLPNVQYYPGIATMDSTQLRDACARILLYGALELLSLVSVHFLLKRRFKLSPLHQLAFTLETEYLLVQGAFVAWVVLILQFPLVHHGVDFTFQFAWITRSAGN